MHCPPPVKVTIVLREAFTGYNSQARQNGLRGKIAEVVFFCGALQYSDHVKAFTGVLKIDLNY